MLLAALCRARGIPARFVAGLVHLPGRQAFGMHAWTEVWIDDRWLALDATMARGGVGAGHLKICDSNLADANPATATLPVSQLLGKALTIECLELGADQRAPCDRSDGSNISDKSTSSTSLTNSTRSD